MYSCFQQKKGGSHMLILQRCNVALVPGWCCSQTKVLQRAFYPLLNIPVCIKSFFLYIVLHLPFTSRCRLEYYFELLNLSLPSVQLLMPKCYWIFVLWESVSVKSLFYAPSIAPRLLIRINQWLLNQGMNLTSYAYIWNSFFVLHG